MAIDKLVDSSQLNSDLTSVANAIRTKGGTSAQLAFPSEFVSAIQAIPTGGGTSYPNIIKFEEVLVTSTATAINIQLIASNDCVVMLMIKDVGSPDASLYKSLWYSVGYSGGSAFTNANAILRPNGTIGSDSGLASFNKTTGVFTFGNGSYGKAIAGDTYYIYQFGFNLT